MSTLALGLVVASAAVHASWNALAKRSDDSFVFLWSLLVASLAVFTLPVIILLIVDPPSPVGIPFIVASGLCHIAYFSLLGRAYRDADLSLAYPVARSTALCLTPLLAIVVYDERPAPIAWVGIALILGGVIWLHGPALQSVLGRTGVGGLMSGWALLTGLTTTTYTLIDAGGAKHVDPVIYLYFVLVIAVSGLTPYVWRHRWPSVSRERRCRARSIVLAGIGLFGTYVIVLEAFRLAPVAYVVPVRELGIVFGALLGTRLMREPFGGSRVAACILVVAGVAVIGIAS